jgi:hypothetical protein
MFSARKVSLSRSSIIATVGFVLSIGATICSAQELRYVQRPTIATTPQIIAGGETSDVAAVNALQRVLAASGGANLWASLRSAKEKFVLLAREGVSKQQLFLDDWSSPGIRYRRGVIGQHLKPIDHDQSPYFPVGPNDNHVEILEFDRSHVLADHLPSAAIAAMIESTSYVLKTVAAEQCSGTSICIDVYSHGRSKSYYEKDQEWEVSRSSNLPISVKLHVPDQGGSGISVWEATYFTNYSTINSYLIPTSMIHRMPGGIIQTLIIENFEPNIDFDRSQFDREIAQ